MKSLRTSLTLALVIAPAAISAQEIRDTTSLSPVVVTAERIPTAARVSTASTSVLSGGELRARGVVTLLDALRTVPGVSLAQTAGPGSQASLFLRGGNSNFTKVLIDGVPVNTPGGAIDIAALTTDNIDRIEILRGPSSVQYGSDAMTGVVQVFTKRNPGSDVAARFASRDAQYDVTGGTTLSAQVGGAARATGTVGGGLHRGNGFLPFNNQYRNATANALGAIAGARGDATLGATYGNARYNYPTTGGGTPTDSNAYTGSNRLTFAASGSWRAADRLTVRTRLSRADTRSVSADAQDSPGDTLGFYSRSHGRALRENADVQLVATLPAAITMTGGGAVEAQRMQSRGWSQFQAFDLGSTSFDETRTNRALYAQVSAGRSLLTGDAGARRERLSNGRFVNTGRIAAASEIIPGTIVRASLGTAFKEPAFDEMFSGPFSVGARDLRPERSRSREAGAESRLAGGHLVLGVTAFDQRFQDLVQYRIVDHSTEPDTPDYYNIVAARARGWELEGRVTPSAPLVVHGSYTFLHTEVTNEGNGGFGALANGKPLLRRPRRSAAADATWSGTHATLSAAVNRVGARDDYSFGFPSQRVRLAPYTLLEAGAEVPLATRLAGGWSVALTARGENLTNRVYENVYGFRTPGRVVFVGLRLHD